jgi:hypothetical protein
LWGRVHVLQGEHPLDEVDLLAIDRAAAAISLALLTSETRGPRPIRPAAP